MNIDALYTITKKACKESYERYKHCILNPLFEVNKCYINQNIEHMREDIGQKIMKQYYAKHIHSTQQYEVMKRIVNEFVEITVCYAYKFGMKHSS